MKTCSSLQSRAGAALGGPEPDAGKGEDEEDHPGDSSPRIEPVESKGVEQPALQLGAAPGGSPLAVTPAPRNRDLAGVVVIALRGEPSRQLQPGLRLEVRLQIVGRLTFEPSHAHAGGSAVADPLRRLLRRNARRILQMIVDEAVDDQMVDVAAVGAAPACVFAGRERRGPRGGGILVASHVRARQVDNPARPVGGCLRHDQPVEAGIDQAQRDLVIAGL